MKDLRRLSEKSRSLYTQANGRIGRQGGRCLFIIYSDLPGA